MHNMPTVIRQISGLQELGGERAVGVLVRLLVSRFSVLPVAAPKCPLLGGTRRDTPASTLDQQCQQLHKAPRENHGRITSKQKQQ